MSDRVKERHAEARFGTVQDKFTINGHIVLFIQWDGEARTYSRKYSLKSVQIVKALKGSVKFVPNLAEKLIET
jgi:hypothetical protein